VPTAPYLEDVPCAPTPWIARQLGDVNRYVQEERTSATTRVLNALKYAAGPPANQDEKVRTGVNLAVN
jgi:hypothetical protein